MRQLAADVPARGITLCLALHPLIAGQAWAPEEAAVRFHPTSGRGWFLRYWEARRPGETIQPDPPIRYGSEADLALLVEKCQAGPDARRRRPSRSAWTTSNPAPPRPASRAWPPPTSGSSTASAPPSSLVPRPCAPRLFVVPTYYWTEGARANAELHRRAGARSARRRRPLLDRRRRPRPRHHRREGARGRRPVRAQAGGLAQLRLERLVPLCDPASAGPARRPQISRPRRPACCSTRPARSGWPGSTP